MNNEKLKNDLDKYLAPEVESVIKSETKEEVVIQPRTGLVERIDKKYVTQDGRQLLREVVND